MILGLRLGGIQFQYERWCSGLVQVRWKKNLIRHGTGSARKSSGQFVFWSLKHGRIGEDNSLLCDLVEITTGHYRVAAYSQHLHRPAFQENLTGPLLHLNNAICKVGGCILK